MSSKKPPEVIPTGTIGNSFLWLLRDSSTETFGSHSAKLIVAKCEQRQRRTEKGNKSRGLCSHLCPPFLLCLESSDLLELANILLSLFFFYFQFLGHIQWYSELSLGSFLRCHSQQCSSTIRSPEDQTWVSSVQVKCLKSF